MTLGRALDTAKKVRCAEHRCTWRGAEDQVLRAPNPFDKDAECWGCPECKSLDSMVRVCDEPDCWAIVTCGTPTPTGYRSTCGKHAP